MSDDKLTQVLEKLAELETNQKAGFAALLERQKADFGMISGALDGVNENIRTVDSSVAQVNLAVKENSKLIAQLRAEHGAFLREIQKETEALDRRVTILEGSE